MREPFILTSPPDAAGLLIVTGDEAVHLIRALRASPGDRFTAFDGKGRGWLATITSVSKSEVRAAVTSNLLIETPPALRVTVAVGAVKGPRMEWAVEKAAELGATRLIPLLTKFGVVEPGEGRVRRWRAIALAAAKQSRRLRLMEIAEPLPLNRFCGDLLRPTCVFDWTPEAAPRSDLRSEMGNLGELTIVIGPEGGFSDRERESLRLAGASFVTLGEHPLRTETAVAVALGAVMSLVGGE